MPRTRHSVNDRDSPYYLENLRDWEYQGLIDIARENLLLGVNVILIGPFSKEIQNSRMFNAQALGMPPQTTIQIAWIDLDASEAKNRMEKRADTRDEWKLAHWDQYVQRRTEPPNHPFLHRFNNATFNEAAFEKLIDEVTR